MIVMSVPEYFPISFTYAVHMHTPHTSKIKRNPITRMIVDTAVVQCLQRRSSGYLGDEGLLAN